jgi:hypothetical protein
MKNRIERLRLVLMESPYDSWNHPLTESLFGKTIGLKLKGYGRAYPYGVLAADTTDLISDHLLVCDETDQGLKPLFGLKSVPLDRCEFHRLAFPGLSVVEASDAPLHCRAVNKIIWDAKANNVDLRYAGSMTIHPDETGDKDWSRTLRELFTTMYVNYHLSLPRRVETLAGGTLRFKVEQYIHSLGHRPIELNGEVLGPVQIAHLAREKVQWTHLKEFSLEARQIARKWKEKWENRIHIEAHRALEQIPSQIQRKAA